jgi:hypothetical protein
VEFDKWFGYTGLDGAGIVELGYARNFGGVYLGARYNGNVLRIANSTQTETEAKTYTLVNGAAQLSQKVTTTEYTSRDTITTNRVDVLIGVAGMGVKVGFAEDLRARDKPNYTATITDYQNGTVSASNDITDYSYINGSLTPSIGWGMALPLGGLTLKPSVGAEFLIKLDNESRTVENYTAVDGKKQASTSSQITKAGKASGYFQPTISAGVDVDFAEKEGAQAGIGLGYTIAFDLYNNEYDVFGQSGTAKGTATWNNSRYRLKQDNAQAKETENYSNITVNEISNIEHTVTPSFWWAKDISDRFSVGFSTEIGFGINSSKDAQTTTETTVTRHDAYTGDPRDSWTETLVEKNYGTEDETTTFTLTPAFNVGASFKVVPDRFNVNFGISAQLPALAATASTKRINDVGAVVTDTVDVTLPGNGVPAAADEYETVTTWIPLNGYFTAGFTLFFTPKAALDVYIDTGTAKNTVNISNLALLFTIKN